MVSITGRVNTAPESARTSSRVRAISARKTLSPWLFCVQSDEKYVANPSDSHTCGQSRSVTASPNHWCAVTERDCPPVWLSGGFATYLSSIWTQRRHGDSDCRAEDRKSVAGGKRGCPRASPRL